MQNFKPFRPWQLDQAALLPYSPREWLEDDRKKRISCSTWWMSWISPKS
jgi:hypothetical protein